MRDFNYLVYRHGKLIATFGEKDDAVMFMSTQYDGDGQATVTLVDRRKRRA